MTNLWNSIVRFVSERLNGSGGPTTREPVRAASEAKEPASAANAVHAAPTPQAEPVQGDRAQAALVPAEPGVRATAVESVEIASGEPASTPRERAPEPRVAAPEPSETDASTRGAPEETPPEPVLEVRGDAEPGPDNQAIEPPEAVPEPAETSRGRIDAIPAEPVQALAGSDPAGLTPEHAERTERSVGVTVSDPEGLTPAPGLEEGTLKVYPWAQSKFVGGVTELVLLTPIIPGPIPGERRTYEERLRSELGSIQRRVNLGLHTPISVIPTIHYAGWQLLRPEQYLQGAVFPSGAPPSLDPYVPADQPQTHDYRFRTWLHFTSHFDGDLKDYLREFSNFLGKDVDRVWGNCEGYPEGGSLDFEAFWQYAKRYQIETDAFFNAYPGLSVPRIYQLKAFKDRFAELVRATRNPDGSSIEDVGGLLDRFIVENQAYTADFPAVGGTYDIDQSKRTADLRKS